MSPKRVGRMIQRLREEKGLSQRQLASRAGVTNGYISQLEAGDKKNPSLAVLQRLAKALGVPVTGLLQ